MDMKERIDKRISTLEATRKAFLQKGDHVAASQSWARLDELKTIKKEFSDKDGNWEE